MRASPLLHGVAVLHADARGVGDGVGDHLAVVGGDGDVEQSGALGLLDGHPAGDLGQLGHLLGTAGLEQLLNTGKTLGDIAAGNAAGVKVRMVSWVPGSPMDWAAMIPTASPAPTGSPMARLMP